jgi:hypothetical protein
MEDATIPVGLYGNLQELMIDISRLPSSRQWLAASGASSSAESSATAPRFLPTGDSRTVRWFVRQGEQVAPTSIAATSLSPAEQLRIGGLVRQEVDRASRVWAEQSGSSTLADAPGELIAPEVVGLQFRYFSGNEVVEAWDSKQVGSLPRAVEVRIWVVPSDSEAAGARPLGSRLPPGTQEYFLTVDLPVGCGGS